MVKASGSSSLGVKSPYPLEVIIEEHEIQAETMTFTVHTKVAAGDRGVWLIDRLWEHCSWDLTLVMRLMLKLSA